MKKFIITTTINPPTSAIIKFSKMPGWKLVVVGDKKTPEKEFKNLKNIIYLSPNDQIKISKSISDLIGWNCVQRRNMGFLFAKLESADIIATVDDDNIPLSNWGKNIVVGKTIMTDIYRDKSGFLDPISTTEHNNLWHRGYPIQLINHRNPKKLFRKKVKCLVQADFWNGDPDIDAIARIAISPEIKFKKFNFFSTDNLTVFNSQNTFIHPSILKYYLMIPGIGRMDDIWGSYLLQQKLSKLKPFIVFGPPTVYQARNDHNLVDDLKKEIIGYEKCIFFNKKKVENFLPYKTKKLIKLYEIFFK